MSKIFELFGYPVDTWDEEAWRNLRTASCPFTGGECDGGGNRYASKVPLKSHRELRRFFSPDLETVQAGVCSLQLREGDQPWIVCPNRMLHFSERSAFVLQKTQDSVLGYTEMGKGQRYKVWTEIKLKTEVPAPDGRNVLFDYSFDYVLSTFRPKPLDEVCEWLGKREGALRKTLVENGLTIARRGHTDWVEDFPDGILTLVEVMTSSTSGGNDEKRTQVGQVFEDTILKLAGADVVPNGPIINCRQVWARMVSQLLVKSQIGEAWGGKTIWVLQDVLADYISKTTALDLSAFASLVTDEVNIVSFGYGKMIEPDKRHGDERLIPMQNARLYAGPIEGGTDGQKGFVDIVKLGCKPSVDELRKRLLLKRPSYCGVV